MKPHLPSLTRLACTAAAAACSLGSLPAANLYWDANGTTGVGGSGTWQDGGASVWNANASGTGVFSAWNNANLDSPFFNGTPGTVTVSGTVRMTNLEFNAGGYALNGGTIASTQSAGTSSTFFKYESGTGDITTTSNIRLEITGSNAGNSLYHIRSKSSSTFELTGNIVVDSGTGGARFVSLQQNVSGTMKLTGNVSYVTNSRVGLYFGYEDASSSAGTYVVSGSNTLGEASAVARGTVLVENSNAFNGSPTIRVGTNETDAGNSASLLTNGSITISQAILLGRGTTATRTVGGNSAHSTTFSGSLSFENISSSVNLTAASGGQVEFSGLIDDGTGSSSIQKTGLGIVRLSRAAGNTYDGGTTVSAGTLLLMNTSNSATGTGGVSVAAGATLGGTGRASGLVTVSGSSSRIAAGDTNAIGTLTLAGGLTASTGATFDVDINGASVDQINFGAGALTLNGDVTINFSNLGTVLTGNPYSLFSGTGTWTGNDGAGLTFNFVNPAGYTLDTSYGGGDGYIWDTSTRTLSVQFAAVPEPGTTALLGLSVGLVLIFRRRSIRR